MMVRRIIWSAVAAALLAVGAIVAVFVGNDSDLVIALGAAAITTAILASRE